MLRPGRIKVQHSHLARSQRGRQGDERPYERGQPGQSFPVSLEENGWSPVSEVETLCQLFFPIGKKSSCIKCCVSSLIFREGKWLFARLVKLAGDMRTPSWMRAPTNHMLPAYHTACVASKKLFSLLKINCRPLFFSSNSSSRFACEGISAWSLEIPLLCSPILQGCNNDANNGERHSPTAPTG